MNRLNPSGYWCSKLILVCCSVLFLVYSTPARAEMTIPEKGDATQKEKEKQRQKSFIERLLDRMTLNLNIAVSFEVRPRYRYRKHVVTIPSGTEKRVFFTRHKRGIENRWNFAVLIGFGLRLFDCEIGYCSKQARQQRRKEFREGKIYDSRSRFALALDFPLGVNVGTASQSSADSEKDARFAFGLGLRFGFTFEGTRAVWASKEQFEAALRDLREVVKRTRAAASAIVGAGNEAARQSARVPVVRSADRLLDAILRLRGSASYEISAKSRDIVLRSRKLTTQPQLDAFLKLAGELDTLLLAAVRRPVREEARRTIHVGFALGILLDSNAFRLHADDEDKVTLDGAPLLFAPETELRMERGIRVMPYFALVIGI